MLDEQKINDEKQTSSVIPDDVLKEFEKVANIEKQMNFLSARQGSIEKAVSVLEEKNKIEATNDVENTISEETKEKSQSKQKEDKNVVKNDDKLKAQLDSIEKKRYENIGVEFAKGADKIFKELEKAKKMQEKMRIKNVENLENKDKDNKDKEEKKKGFSFLKLGLAIAAVGALLYLFRDTIDKFIPGFKGGAETVFTPIKDGATKIFGTIIDSIVGVFHTIFDSIFDGKDGVKETMRLFFLSTLPDVMFRSGLAIISALGGKVDANVASFEGKEETAINAAMKFAEDEAKRRQVDAQQQAELHRQILLDPFSQPGEIETAARRMGIDSMMAVGGDLYKRVATLFEVNEKQFITQSAYAGNFMSAIFSQRELISKGYSEENDAELAKVIYKHKTGKTADSNKEDFDNWYKNSWSKQINADTWKQLQAANEQMAQRITAYETLGKSAENLEDYRRQLNAAPRVSGLRFDSKDNSQLVLNIKPEDIAQNALAAECSVLFGDLKTLFSGDDVNLPDLAKESLTFINDLIRGLLEPFINSFIKLEKFISDLISSFGIPKTTSNSSSSSGSGVHGGIYKTLSGNNNDDNDDKTTGPVILIDFDLNGSILGVLDEMFSEYPKIVETMKGTNEMLKKIAGFKIDKPEKPKEEADKPSSNREAWCVQQIDTLDKRINNIEDYLEAQDGVDDDGKTKDFVLQATGS